MFEIGKTYSFVMIKDGQTSYSAHEVADWQAPLLKLSTADGGELIVNTASQSFVEAKPYRPSVYETRGLLSI